MGLLIKGATCSTHLSVAFLAGYLTLSFGIADFVLYIWVDDVFVRSNKTLGLTWSGPAIYDRQISA